MNLRPLLSTALLSALLCASAALHAENRRYEFDPVHSRIVFFVQHAGFSRAIGTFSGVTGTLDFDPGQPSIAVVRARVPIDSLDLGDAKWRKRVLDPTFFGVERHPHASFTSTAVQPDAEGTLRVTGDLTLHGVTREITLEARLNQLQRHPLTLRRTAGFSARTRLSRAAFGMEKWKNLVGDEVEVLIEIEAVRARARGDD